MSIKPCRDCGGSGRRRQPDGVMTECDHCAGTGLRKPCSQADCYEYGCSWGECVPTPDEVAAYRAALGLHQ